MGYGKGFLALLTAVFLAAALLAWTQEPGGEEVNTTSGLRVEVLSGGEWETIRCYQGERGEYYLFLPGYADLDSTRILLSQGQQGTLNDMPLVSGMSMADLEAGVWYPLNIDGKESWLQFVISGAVPALFLESASGSMDFIHADKTNAESGKLRLYDSQGSLDHGGSVEAISGRGNSTWDQAKKPYNLKLSAQADLLDMGSAQKWILIANFTDRSHLRNKLVFDFAAQAGLAYSPDSQWVDLYLNGDYQGLYLLCERNELHPQRVDLSQDSGFLVSMEVLWRLEKQGYPHIVTDSKTALRIHQGQPELLQDKWQSLENAILAEDGVDPVTGAYYLDLIDLDSWVRKFLVEEMFGNGDAGALSQFFYGSSEGKVYAGPVWDYDISMGLGIWQMTVPNAFYANRPWLRAGMQTNWFHALYQKQEFYDRMVALYQQELRQLMQQLLDQGIEDLAAQVQGAALANQIRWNQTDPAAEAEAIRQYLTQRLSFLDSIWLENREYCTVTVDLADGSNAACFVIAPGETVPLLPEYSPEEGVLGWYDWEKDLPFDPDQPVYEDTIVILKREAVSQAPVQPEEAVEEAFPLRRMAPAVLLAVALAAAALADKLRSGY